MPYHDRLRSPEGWRWHRRPVASTGAIGLLFTDPPGGITTEQALSLYEWGMENETLVILDRVHQRAQVYPTPYDFPSMSHYWQTTTCSHGLQWIVPAYERCECAVGSEALVCERPGCNEVRYLMDIDGGERRCESHVRNCRTVGCSIRIPREFNYCSQHRVDITCTVCNLPQTYAITEAPPHPDVCWGCHDRHTCASCHTFNIRQRLTNADGQRLCSDCHATWSTDRIEVFDEEPGALLTPQTLALQADDHRPIRTCSIELETARGGIHLARALGSAGLSEWSEVLGYHSNAGRQPASCYVERDSSLGDGGGELIISKIDLSDDDQLDKLHRIIIVLRDLVKAGTLEINLRCGTHLHVDAHNFGIGHTRNLVIVTNFLEDVIYRLSASRWKRHRGQEYAIPVNKGPFPTRREFGVRFFQNNEHHSALNLENYWRAIRNCECGATLTGEHESCVCSLGKCTFEFRFFNGTSNFRKIHAYAALCQSMVAYAKLVPDLLESDFPVFEYQENAQIDFSDELLTKWDHRLRWMLTNLYFSDSERESLRYTVATCVLNELGERRIEDIFTTEYVRPSVPRQEVVHPDDRAGDGFPSLRRSPRFNPSDISFIPIDNIDDEYDDEF